MCALWGLTVLQPGAWDREGGGQTDMLKSILFRLLGNAPREDSQRVSAYDCQIPSLGARPCLRDSP